MDTFRDPRRGRMLEARGDPMATASPLTTAEQLLHEATGLGRCELVRGELRMMSPAGSRHGAVAIRIATLVANHVDAHGLGQVFAAETGCILARDPDTVRAPDVSFVGRERLGGGLPAGYFPGPPDLVVEVLSPDDRPAAVAAKTADWLAAGTRLVWNVDPADRSLVAHAADGTVGRSMPSATVPAGDVVPGFTLALERVFG
jgi:Uma2 family endonuclease